MKEVTAGLVGAGVCLATAAGAVAARKAGLLEPETVERIVFGVYGLIMAWWGNRLPKAMVPRTRPTTRVSAWSQVLSGLAYAGLWAFAPFRVATLAGAGVLVLGVAVTFAYCLTARDARSTARG